MSSIEKSRDFASRSDSAGALSVKNIKKDGKTLWSYINGDNLQSAVTKGTGSSMAGVTAKWGLRVLEAAGAAFAGHYLWQHIFHSDKQKVDKTTPNTEVVGGLMSALLNSEVQKSLLIYDNFKLMSNLLSGAAARLLDSTNYLISMQGLSNLIAAQYCVASQGEDIYSDDDLAAVFQNFARKPIGLTLGLSNFSPQKPLDGAVLDDLNNRRLFDYLAFFLEHTTDVFVSSPNEDALDLGKKAPSSLDILNNTSTLELASRGVSPGINGSTLPSVNVKSLQMTAEGAELLSGMI